MSMSKKNLKWIVAGAAAVVVAYLGYQYWEGKQNAVPEGIAWGNGRLEAKLVDGSEDKSGLGTVSVIGKAFQGSTDGVVL